MFRGRQKHANSGVLTGFEAKTYIQSLKERPTD
jgi:hypothetical protein